jgi:solute carrier family 20 (sodium-dependent phosphate transporter)
MALKSFSATMASLVVTMFFLPVVLAEATPFTAEYTWVLALAIIASLITSYGIGANDVSNSFASAVGAKALSLRTGVYLASMFEFLGSILAGAAVADTIRGGIANQKAFENNPELLMYGMFIVCVTTGMWLLLATSYGLPVSTTHSAVGSIVGMSIACAGWDAVVWYKEVNTFPYVGGLSGIILSWIISPVLACAFSVVLFGATRVLVLRQKNSFQIAKYAFPVYAFVAIWFASNAVISKGLPQQKKQIEALPGGMEGAPAWLAAIVGAAFAVLAGTAGNYYVSKWLEADDTAYSNKISIKLKSIGDCPNDLKNVVVRKVTVAGIHKDTGLYKSPTKLKVEEEHRFFGLCGGPVVPQFIRNLGLYKWLNDGLDYDVFACIDEDESVGDTQDACEQFDFKTEELYRYLQVFTSCFNMFAHGSNDVANSIGPFAAVYLVWNTGSITSKAPVDQWIIAMGGIMMSLGVMTYGYKIIEVMGVKMTKISNTRGLCIDMSSAIVVILATNFGLPVSSTQTVTGSIIGVGILDGRSGVNWKLMMKVFGGWALTLIFTGFSAAIITSWAVFAPHVNSVRQRVDVYQQLNRTSTLYATLLARSENPTWRSWGEDILANQTKKLKLPAWDLNVPLKTLNYTCERGFLAAGSGLMNVSQTMTKK